MVGKILNIQVKAGDEVQEDDTIIVMAAVTIWYYTSARKTFKGPIRTIDLGAEGSEINVAPEPSAP